MKLLSWGANSYSQLGHGRISEQCTFPTSISDEEERLNLTRVVDVKCGGGHTLVLDKDGRMFSCGWNSKGQLGLPVSSASLSLKCMTCVEDLKISHICCGWESSYAVTSGKELLVWGSNSFGQLGLERREIFLSSTPLRLSLPPVKTLATGLRHTAIVTENGNVLVCGNGRKGQLGLMGDDGGPLFEETRPHIIPDVSNVTTVACGQYHTVVITDEGRMYAWGDNKHGQLGLDPTLHPSVFKPAEIHLFGNEQLPSECSIVCGWTHTALVTGNGDIYNWGRNTYGQLGCCGYERSVNWQPHKMANIHRVKQLAVGSEHNIALLDSGEIVSWGWNEHGNCGIGTEMDVTEPTHVKIDEHYKAVLVSAGGGHSFALIED
ncbi:hypothetical protein R5R35_011742 [Gryllus longicercus]|uniref:RCC1-like domain-containing protein n=1 Tax=Gryllus longicercus TaxID=2509291 RepID=A0AAN9UZ49_9ORTH